MRWKPSSSHHPTIKLTPKNARTLFLAPTAIIWRARITSVEAGFNTISSFRWAKLTLPFDVGTSAAAGLDTDVSSFAVQCLPLTTVWEKRLWFWRAEVSTNRYDLTCACARSDVYSPTQPSHPQRPASILNLVPATLHCRLWSQRRSHRIVWGKNVSKYDGNTLMSAFANRDNSHHLSPGTSPSKPTVWGFQQRNKTIAKEESPSPAKRSEPWDKWLRVADECFVFRLCFNAKDKVMSLLLLC